MNKNLPLLAVVLIVLIGIIVISNQLQNKKPSEQSLVFLPQFSLQDCSELRVIEGKDSAKIVRKATGWFVVAAQTQAAAPLGMQNAAATQSPGDEYPADSAAVQAALDKLKSLKKDDLISRNPQKQSELEVDSGKGVSVEALNDKGKSLGSIYIGKSGSSWDSHFIREKGSNDVYLASGNVKYSFFGDAKRWKDKTITKFDKAFIKSLHIAKGDSAAIDVVKINASPTDTSKKEGWEIEKPEQFKAKKEKVEDILNSFSRLNAAEFETDKSISNDSMGFAKPSLVLSATTQNGETKTVIVGKKKGSSGQYWVKNPENTKAIFLLAEYSFNSLNQGLGALKDVPEVKKETEKSSSTAKPATIKAAQAKAAAPGAKKEPAVKKEPPKKK
jgi:hypothetical protein